VSRAADRSGSGPGPADCRERCAHHGPRPGTDHVVFTKPRMPSRPALASLFARSWAPPFTLRAGPPGAAPLTTPQWGCAPSRGTPDGLIPIVLRASGWRSSPVPGARPRLRPPARRGRVSRSHPQAIHWPSTGFSTGYPPDRYLVAPLGTDEPRADCSIGSYSLPDSERGLGAGLITPYSPDEAALPHPHYARAAGHRTSWNAPCAGRLFGWAMLSGGSKRSEAWSAGRAFVPPVLGRGRAPPPPNLGHEPPKQGGVFWMAGAAARSPPWC